MRIQVEGAQLLTERVMFAEALQCHDNGTMVSDAFALTVASWYQTSGTRGSAFAALASGAPADVEELWSDVLGELAGKVAPSNDEEYVQTLSLDLFCDWLSVQVGAQHLDHDAEPDDWPGPPMCKWCHVMLKPDGTHDTEVTKSGAVVSMVPVRWHGLGN